MTAQTATSRARSVSTRLAPGFLVLSLLLGGTTARGLSFEIVSDPVLTDPYALTTRNFTHNQAIDGAQFTYSFGFDTYALDATVLPEQWILDSILEFAGLNNSTELVGLSIAETLFSFSTTLRLTGNPGERAAISYSPYVSGSYTQFYGAVPSADTSSRIRLDYWINGPGISGRENVISDDGGLIGTSTGTWARSDGRVPGFEMMVGDTVNVSGAFSVRSAAEVNPACITVCVPFTDLCRRECVAGAGFAFAGTKGLGGLSLYADLVPVSEPGTLALLGLGLAGLGLSCRRRAN